MNAHFWKIKGREDHLSVLVAEEYRVLVARAEKAENARAPEPPKTRFKEIQKTTASYQKRIKQLSF
jgi:hypothetical protein